MKLKQYLILLGLLLAAGLLGWFLPVLVAEGGDRAAEGRTEAVSLRQVDLSYQSDLDTADRLRLVQEDYLSTVRQTSLERGIYLDEAQVREILGQFTGSLTGRQFRLTSRDCSMTPILLSFPEEGAFLAWAVTATLDDDWFLEAIVDDETGLLLRCTLHSSGHNWEDLFPGLEGVGNAEDYLCQALRTAICSHYNTRLSDDLQATLAHSPKDPYFSQGELLLYRDGAVVYRIPYLFALDESLLFICN